MSANAIDLRSDAVGCPDYWGKSHAICFYRLACFAAFEGGDKAGEAGGRGPFHGVISLRVWTYDINVNLSY